MPKVLKRLPYQGKVLCHHKVLCLIKPCHSVWINESTSGMLLQKILPKLEDLNVCLPFFQNTRPIFPTSFNLEFL
jgi:hypothetical protein